MSEEKKTRAYLELEWEERKRIHDEWRKNQPTHIKSSKSMRADGMMINPDGPMATYGWELSGNPMISKKAYVNMMLEQQESAISIFSNPNTNA